MDCIGLWAIFSFKLWNEIIEKVNMFCMLTWFVNRWCLYLFGITLIISLKWWCSCLLVLLSIITIVSQIQNMRVRRHLLSSTAVFWNLYLKIYNEIDTQNQTKNCNPRIFRVNIGTESNDLDKSSDFDSKLRFSRILKLKPQIYINTSEKKHTQTTFWMIVGCLKGVRFGRLLAFASSDFYCGTVDSWSASQLARFVLIKVRTIRENATSMHTKNIWTLIHFTFESHDSLVQRSFHSNYCFISSFFYVFCVFFGYSFSQMLESLLGFRYFLFFVKLLLLSGIHFHLLLDSVHCLGVWDQVPLVP